MCVTLLVSGQKLLWFLLPVVCSFQQVSPVHVLLGLQNAAFLSDLKGIIFLILLFTYLLLIYRNLIDFRMPILHFTALLNSPLSSRNFVLYILWDFICRQFMSSPNINSFISSFSIYVLLISLLGRLDLLHCLEPLILCRIRLLKYDRLVPDLGGKHSVFHF